MAGLDPQRVLAGRPPRRPSTFVVLGVTGMCLCGLAAFAVIALTSGPVPFALGVALAVLPVPVLVSGVLGLDQLEPEPTRKLVLAFVWGASVAVLVAGIINTAGLSLTTTLLGVAEGTFVSAAIGAPIIEETLKAAVIVGFLRFGHQELDGPTDGIIYAAMVGLGFAMTENILYYASAAAHLGVSALLGTFVLRGLIAPFAHPLFTSMTGMALGFAALQRRRALRIGVPIIGLLAAMTLHSLWNAAAGAGILLLAFFYFVILLPILLGVIAVTLLDRHRMARLIARILPRYSETGLVTPGEVQMLSKLSYRRRARFWAKASGGKGAAHAMRNYQLAATELALLDDRVARGVANPEVVPRRKEALLDLMARSRSAFLAPAHQHAGPPWSGPPWLGGPPSPPNR